MPQLPLREQLHLLPAIALGGALGTLGRWALAELLPHRADAWPWSVLLANVVGSLLLGVLTMLVVGWSARRWVGPMLGIGVLGGFTTFSAYVLDTRTLLAHDRPGLALLYVAGSVVAGLAATGAGLELGGRLVDARSAREAHSSGTPEALR